MKVSKRQHCNSKQHIKMRTIRN